MSNFVAFDLEGTLTAGVAWEGMRDYLLAHDEGQKFRRFFSKRILQVGLYRFGFIKDDRAFKERWILDMLALFSGYSVSRMNEVAAWVVEKTFWPRRRVAVVEELEAHQHNGRSAIIVSGMFTPFLTLFAAKLRAEYAGTSLAFRDGRFTGKIAAPLNVGQNKVQRLQEWVGDDRLYAAYGDTRGDIPMLRLADHPVAVHPDPHLRREASSHNWRIMDSPQDNNRRFRR